MPPISSIKHPYQLTRMRAKGEFSTTYDATDIDGNHVIVKLPRTNAHKKTLQHEGKILQSISDLSGVTKLIDAPKDGSWLTVTPIDGIAIHVWANGKPLSTIIDTIIHLTAIIESLHKLGFTHGDIKPNNVLVSRDNTPTLIDFGSAASRSIDPSGTDFTPGFAAPELLRGETYSEASDHYALGALIYMLLTGTNPFRTVNEAALRHLPLISLPFPPSALNPLVPKTLDELTLKLLFREPSARMHSFQKINDMLTAAKTETPAPPCIGMASARESLMRAVVSGLDGTCVVVSIYGKKGSGRTKLATSALEVAVAYGYQQNDQVNHGHITDPTVTLLRNPTADQTAQLLSAMQSNRPLLAFVLTKSPHAELINAGALGLSPKSLTTEEINQIGLHLVSVNRLDPAVLEDKTFAATIQSATKGLPTGVHTAFLRLEHKDSPQSLIAALPSELREVFRLIDSGISKIAELLTHLTIDELELINLVDLLTTCKLVTVSPNSLKIQVVKNTN
jgi:predicted Ser/Thr protein kinase